MSEQQTFSNFDQFYPYYLREHSHPLCRLMHYIGSTLVLVVLYLAISSSAYTLLWWLPVIGYGFAWLGHFFIEKNRPATFTYPFYSLFGDWVMYKDFLTGQLGKKLEHAGVISSVHKSN